MVVPEDGTIRICGDFLTTVNKAVKVAKYSLSKVVDMFAAIGESTVLSKIDLLHAYLQMELDDGARERHMINTHKWLYRYNRLPFGVSSAPAILAMGYGTGATRFPKHNVYWMTSLATEDEHLQIIEEVLVRLDQYEMTLNKAKCAPSDGQGLQTNTPSGNLQWYVPNKDPNPTP